MRYNITLYALRFLPLHLLAMLVNILAQAVHETGHYLIYQVMGHDPVWAFTKVVQMSEQSHCIPMNGLKKHTLMVLQIG